MSYQVISEPRDDIERALFVAYAGVPARSSQEQQSLNQFALDLINTPDGWVAAQDKFATLMSEHARLPVGPTYGLLQSLHTAAKHHDDLNPTQQNQLRSLALALASEYMYAAGFTEGTPFNGLATLFVLLAKYEYPSGQWSSFFADLIQLCEMPEAIDLLVRILKVLEEDLIQARFSGKAQQTEATRELVTLFKDCMKDRGDAARLVTAFATSFLPQLLNTNPMLADKALKTLSCYVEWMPIELFVTEHFFPLLYELLAQPSTRVGAAGLLAGIISKPLQHATDVIVLLNQIQIVEALGQINLLADSYAPGGDRYGTSATNSALTNVESTCICGAGDDPCDASDLNRALPDLVASLTYTVLTALCDLYTSYPKSPSAVPAVGGELIPNAPRGAPGGPITALEYFAQREDAEFVGAATKGEESLEGCMNLVLTLLRHSNFEMGMCVIDMITEFTRATTSLGVIQFDARQNLLRNLAAVLVDLLAFPDWFVSTGTGKTHRCERYEEYHVAIKKALANVLSSEPETIRSYFLETVHQVLVQIDEITEPVADAIPNTEDALVEEVLLASQCEYPSPLFVTEGNRTQDALSVLSREAFECRTQRYAAIAPLIASVPFQPITAVIELSIVLASGIGTPTVLSNQSMNEAIQALIRSPLSYHPSPTLANAYLQLVQTYNSILNANPALVPYVIGFLVDSRGIGSVNSHVRARSAYMFKSLLTTQGARAPDLKGLGSMLNPLLERVQYLLTQALQRVPTAPEGLLSYDSTKFVSEGLPMLFIRTLTGSDEHTADCINTFGELYASALEDAAANLEGWFNACPQSDCVEIISTRIESAASFMRGLARVGAVDPDAGAPAVVNVVGNLVARMNQAVGTISECACSINEVRLRIVTYLRSLEPYNYWHLQYIPAFLEPLVLNTNPATLSDMLSYITYLIINLKSRFDENLAQYLGPMMEKAYESIEAVDAEVAEYDELNAQTAGTAGNIPSTLLEAISTARSALRDSLDLRTSLHTNYLNLLSKIIESDLLINFVFGNDANLGPLLRLMQYGTGVGLTHFPVERVKMVLRHLSSFIRQYSKYLDAGGARDVRVQEYLVSAIPHVVQLPFINLSFPCAIGSRPYKDGRAWFNEMHKSALKDVLDTLRVFSKTDDGAYIDPMGQSLVEIGWDEGVASHFLQVLREIPEPTGLIRTGAAQNLIDTFFTTTEALVAQRASQ